MTARPKGRLVDPCRKCGQHADSPPGFYLADGPEAIIIGDSEANMAVILKPDVVRCRACDAVVHVGIGGSVGVRAPTLN